MLVLTLILYFLIFVGLGIYDFLNFSGWIMYTLLTMDIIFGIFIISSTIDSYIRKKSKK